MPVRELAQRSLGVSKPIKRLCYNLRMTQNTKEVLKRVGTWPQEDQEELAELAREIEARRSGVYEPTAEEEAAIREGLAELDRGEFVTEEEIRFFIACFCLKT
jgi:hypothetical protein